MDLIKSRPGEAVSKVSKSAPIYARAANVSINRLWNHPNINPTWLQENLSPPQRGPHTEQNRRQTLRTSNYLPYPLSKDLHGAAQADRLFTLPAASGTKPGEEGFPLIFQRSWVQHHLCSVLTGLLCDLCRVSTLPETPLRAWELQIQPVILFHVFCFFFFKQLAYQNRKLCAYGLGSGAFTAELIDSDMKRNG